MDMELGNIAQGCKATNTPGTIAVFFWSMMPSKIYSQLELSHMHVRPVNTKLPLQLF